MPRRKRKTNYLDYSGTEKNETFGRLYGSVLKSEQYKQLSIGAKYLYCCCRAQESTKEGRQCLFQHGDENGTAYIAGRDFVFPASHLEKYGINRSNSVRWFRELENAGFITVRERNKNRRKMNVYSFSSGWKGP